MPHGPGAVPSGKLPSCRTRGVAGYGPAPAYHPFAGGSCSLRCSCWRPSWRLLRRPGRHGRQRRRKHTSRRSSTICSVTRRSAATRWPGTWAVTDEELMERLRREPQISAASAYTDTQTARRAVTGAIEQSRRRIDEWNARQGSRPNLVLTYVQPGGQSIGRSLTRGERTSRPCDRARVVLRWLDRQKHWIVLTSYPETRR